MVITHRFNFAFFRSNYCAGSGQSGSAFYLQSFLSLTEIVFQVKKRGEMDLELLKNALIKLFHRGFEKDKIQRLFNYLANLEEEQLPQIFPNLLAIKLDFSFQETLKLVTYGVLDGVFQMEWQVSCPQCHSLNFATDSLKNLRLHEHCNICGANYEPEGDQNVQVVLSLHPHFFDQMLNKPERAQIKIDPRVQPLTVLDLIGYPDFREHFTNQVPRMNQGIKIRNASIMFTDLYNSTQMYEKIGDVQAFLLVNEHFEILFATISQEYGGIIKTIGDAVMAVFKDTRHALEAAIEIKKKVDAFLKSRLQNFSSGIKIGLHSGPAIVVNLNENFDLFGGAVNKAARLVSFAQTNAIAMSQDFFDQTQAFLNHNINKTIQKKEVRFKGLRAEQTIFLLNFENFTRGKIISLDN